MYVHSVIYKFHVVCGGSCVVTCLLLPLWFLICIICITGAGMIDTYTVLYKVCMYVHMRTVHTQHAFSILHVTISLWNIHF
jgi:hypothetical protein